VQQNHGDQVGDGSINIGIGDFRSANIHVGSEYKPIDLEKISIKRHFLFKKPIVNCGNLSTFGVITGLSSVAGLYVTLFQNFPTGSISSWSFLFLFSFLVGGISFLTSRIIKNRKFEAFLFHKYYIELGPEDGIFITSFTAVCPWCGSKMSLFSRGGGDEGPIEDYFVCVRRPSQHEILLDPTELPDIGVE
jgi:hypothetical protein